MCHGFLPILFLWYRQKIDMGSKKKKKKGNLDYTAMKGLYLEKMYKFSF